VNTLNIVSTNINQLFDDLNLEFKSIQNKSFL